MIVRVNIHDFTFKEFDRDNGLVSNQRTVMGIGYSASTARQGADEETSGSIEFCKN